MQPETHLLLRRAVLILRQFGVLDQTGQLMQVFETLLQRGLGELSQWQFIGVVTNLLEYSIKVILIEDELYQSLRLSWQLAVYFRLVGFFLFDLVGGVIIVVVVVFVILFQEGVFSLLGGFRSIFPFVARFIFEFLFKVFECVVEGIGTHGFDLAEFADTTPAGVSVILVLLLTMKKL